MRIDGYGLAVSVWIPLADVGLRPYRWRLMARPLVEQLAQLAVGVHCPIAADEMGIVDV